MPDYWLEQLQEEAFGSRNSFVVELSGSPSCRFQGDLRMSIELNDVPKSGPAELSRGGIS
jgi:hypothetical protein